jgi:Ca2+-binding RTX toxin-like protein
VTVAGPTALGLTADASQTQAGLRPLLIDDEFSFGLGVCGFGGVSAKDDFSNFWELRVDHKAVSVGGDQVAVGRGDDILWSLVPNNCDSTPPYACHASLPELSIDAPARAKPGKPFVVQVFQYSDKGFTKPAAGAIVTGAPAPSDASGNALVTLATGGTVQATRAGAIPSRAFPVCVNSNLSRCPKKAGRPIFGSALADDITGTPGPDSIKSAAGNDAINVRGGGKDQVQCGAGIDKVKADRSDKVDRVSCERIIRRGGGKAHKK